MNASELGGQEPLLPPGDPRLADLRGRVLKSLRSAATDPGLRDVLDRTIGNGTSLRTVVTHPAFDREFGATIRDSLHAILALSPEQLAEMRAAALRLIADQPAQPEPADEDDDFSARSYLQRR